MGVGGGGNHNKKITNAFDYAQKKLNNKKKSPFFLSVLHVFCKITMDNNLYS